MLLGEGAAILVLEREADAIARGARPLAVVGALGLSCDAYHATAPDPRGDGAARALRSALAAQHLEASDIDWYCAHGTGTSLSDSAEAAALKQVFGADVPPITSIKGALGHSMGAASAIEAAVCILAIDRQQAPPSTGLDEPAFDLPFVNEPLLLPMRWVANAGFAFGGLNAVLLLGAP
jgi:3-oxoacyl-[acyl-carrier-protein] synthase II